MKDSGVGIGLPTILFVVFLVLKLCGVIAWSWLWVMAPLWIPLAVVVAVVVAVVIAAAVCSYFEKP